MAQPGLVEVTEEFLESLTVEDVETIEDIVGVPVDDIFSGSTPVKKGKLMRALGFVLKRHADPDYTLEQAGKLSLGAIAKLLDESQVATAVPLPDASA